MITYHVILINIKYVHANIINNSRARAYCYGGVCSYVCSCKYRKIYWSQIDVTW